ncbi:hypothetical protein D3C80_1783930 [compost metagenome]
MESGISNFHWMRWQEPLGHEDARDGEWQDVNYAAGYGRAGDRGFSPSQDPRSSGQTNAGLYPGGGRVLGRRT